MNRKTIQQIAYNFPTIKFLTGSKEVVNILATNKVNMKNIIYIPNSSWYDLGILKVKLELLEHDVENYALHFEIKSKKGIYIVDTASVENINAKGYDLYLIEANYQEEILEEHLKNCEDKDKIYLERVKYTHLSYEMANDFLIRNMEKNSEYSYIHKSEYNFKEE